MTVNELIAKLSTFAGEKPVVFCVDMQEYDFDDVSFEDCDGAVVIEP